ncbi:hypothetical protein [Streptomyces sp. NPDC008150]|uniref:hypothetical protein n=1 Tax=Streptomyces sp. NPDC008150 TaxID=3364816 RepID=UPI0036E498A2
MPDRSPRLLSLPPRSPRGGERVGVLLRERPTSPPDASSGRPDGGQGDGPKDDNPFAPPPEGAPDKPWQPRRPAGDDPRSSADSGGDGPPPAWGSQWSDRQPGRSPSGFGERPGQGGGQNGGKNGPQGPGPGMRWDPTDPAQRHARYALLCGMWGFFFALFGWTYVALLLGALSLYWGISALRAKPRAVEQGAPDPAGAPSRPRDAAPGAGPAVAPAPARPAGPGGAPVTTGRPQTTAAVTGLVTAGLAIFLVAAQFTAHLAYRDYYSCTKDALTSQARQSCDQHLPSQLRDLLGTEG